MEDQITILDVKAALRALRRYQKQKDEITERLKAAQEIIQLYMSAKEIDELILSGYKVSWKQIVYNQLDSKALTRECPDLVARYSHAVITRRFKVGTAPIDAHH